MEVWLFYSLIAALLLGFFSFTTKIASERKLDETYILFFLYLFSSIYSVIYLFLFGELNIYLGPPTEEWNLQLVLATDNIYDVQELTTSVLMKNGRGSSQATEMTFFYLILFESSLIRNPILGFTKTVWTAIEFLISASWVLMPQAITCAWFGNSFDSKKPWTLDGLVNTYVSQSGTGALTILVS